MFDIVRRIKYFLDKRRQREICEESMRLWPSSFWSESYASLFQERFTVRQPDIFVICWQIKLRLIKGNEILPTLILDPTHDFQ
jgi:hypothetical protein